jgi:hypothetical protein
LSIYDSGVKTPTSEKAVTRSPKYGIIEETELPYGK